MPNSFDRHRQTKLTNSGTLKVYRRDGQCVLCQGLGTTIPMVIGQESMWDLLLRCRDYQQTPVLGRPRGLLEMRTDIDSYQNVLMIVSTFKPECNLILS